MERVLKFSCRCGQIRAQVRANRRSGIRTRCHCILCHQAMTHFGLCSDLSLFYAAPSARLGHLPLECDGAFLPKAEWRRCGLWKPLMYSKIAILACRRVSRDLSQISSALMGLKEVSTAVLSQQLPLPRVDKLNPCWRKIF